MCKTKTDNHKKCCINTLSNKFDIKFIDESNFSYLFSNETLIAKCRKHYSNVFGSITEKKAINLGYAEYERGSKIESNIYIDIIDVRCLYDEKLCTSALIMKKLPISCRLDSLYKDNALPKNIGKIIQNKITNLQSNSTLSKEYDYVNGLQTGNSRIINLIRNNQNLHKKEKRFFLKEWDEITDLTQSFKPVLKAQVINKGIRNLHGDLSWKNIFYTENLYLLDPCVAYKDMYKLDLFYQKVDPIVCFLARDCKDHVIDSINYLKEINSELFYFYLKRHSLIRATINYISKDDLFKKYLRLSKNLYDY